MIMVLKHVFRLQRHKDKYGLIGVLKKKATLKKIDRLKLQWTLQSLRVNHIKDDIYVAVVDDDDDSYYASFFHRGRIEGVKDNIQKSKSKETEVMVIVVRRDILTSATFSFLRVVLGHELAHLSSPSHGKRFYKAMGYILYTTEKEVRQIDDIDIDDWG